MKKLLHFFEKFVAPVALIALLLGAAPAAFAQNQPSGLSFSAEAAFGGNFKYGEWLPVWVELENSGPAVDAEVRVSVQSGPGATTFSAPVSLPTVSRKRFPVYVLANNFSREIEVRVIAGETLLASEKVAVRPQANISYLIGIIAPERGALAFLNNVALPGLERPKVLVDLTLDDLPDRVEGLRSFDLLVLNDTDTSTLAAEQVAALEKWVHQGGRLVIGGGAGAQRTTAGLPEALLPLSPAEEVEAAPEDLSGLADYSQADPVRVPGPFILASGGPRSGRTLAAAVSRGLPLLQEMAFGAGFVDYVALDLAGSPFDAWNGTAAFWETLLSPGGGYPEGLPPDMSMRQMRTSQIPYALSNMPVLDLPSVRGLSLLLGLYILLVGPVNYLVLRSLKRMHWAWISIPLITVIFSAGSFGVGYALRGTDLVLNKIALVELQPGGSAAVSTYLGLFSPGQQAYEIEVAGNGLLSPISSYNDPWGPSMPASTREMVFVQGDPGQVRGLSVDQFSMQSFMVENTWPDFGTVQGDLRLEGDRLVGTVENRTAYPLSDVVVILGRQFARLQDLAPGESAFVDLSLVDFSGQRFGPPLSYLLFEEAFASSGPNGPQRDLEVRRMILDSILNGGPAMKLSSTFPISGAGPVMDGPVLLGWLDQAPPEVLIAGKTPVQKTTALVYTALHYSMAQDGPLSLPPGLVPGVIQELPRDGGTCGDPSTLAVYLGSGEAVYEFYLPQEIQANQVDRLKLSLATDGGWWRAPVTALYDWEHETWTELGEVIQGINIIEDAGSLVSRDGAVRVRLSGENIQTCFYVGLGLDAQRQPGQGG